jgi:hypothetical protein
VPDCPDLRQMYSDGILTTDVRTAGAALGIGQGLSYEAARKGELPGVLKLGGRYVVSIPILLRALGALGGEEAVSQSP